MPFVKAFLLQSHQKVLEWAKQAIELDDVRAARAGRGGRRCRLTRGRPAAVCVCVCVCVCAWQFKPVTAEAGYSTSVVDLFNIVTSVRARPSPTSMR